MSTKPNVNFVPPVMDMYKEYKRVKNMDSATPQTKANELCLRIGKAIKAEAGTGQTSIGYDFGQLASELHITIGDQAEVLRLTREAYTKAGYDIKLEVQRKAASGRGSMLLLVSVQWTSPPIEHRRDAVAEAKRLAAEGKES